MAGTREADASSRREVERPRRGTAHRIGLAAALLGLLAACTHPRLPDVPPPPEPFERYPYVQAVTDSSATLVWNTTRPTADTLLYWLSGGPTPLDTFRMADRDPTRLHRFDLAALPADTPVSYRVASSDRGRRTSAHRFRTAPPRDTKKAFTVLIWGDSGWGSDAQVDLAHQMSRRRFDLALHTGDIAYDHGSEFDFTHRHFRVYRDLLAETPLFPALGNHDLRTAGGAPADRAFVLPHPAEPEGRRYYSFDWGSAHFIALNTNEEDGSLGDLVERGEQYEWLVSDLEAATTDPRTDWVIVYMHRPVYSTATGFSGHGSDRDLRDVLTPLFDRYAVDIVFAGHDHFYERSFPLRGGEVATETPGTVYLVTGGGGASQRWRGVDRDWHTAIATSDYHFLSLRVTPSELSVEAIGRDGERFDSFVVRQRSETVMGSTGVLEPDGASPITPH